MPKTKSFYTDYGYTRHPDDKDGVCFWCGEPAHGTWDYTPCRDIARIPGACEKIGQEPIAVTACRSCISTATYWKIKVRTIPHKMILFKDIRDKKARKRATIEGSIETDVSIHPWQYRDVETGAVMDYFDEVLDQFPKIKAMKMQWIQDQAKKNDKPTIEGTPMWED